MILDLALGIVLGVILLSFLPEILDCIMIAGSFIGIAILIVVGGIIALILGIISFSLLSYLSSDHPTILAELIIFALIAYIWFPIFKDKAKTKKVNNAIKTTDDIFDKEIEAVSVQSKAAIENANKEQRNELERRYAADIKLKDDLINFALKHGLDRALVAVWDEVKSYPIDSEDKKASSKTQIVIGSEWIKNQIIIQRDLPGSPGLTMEDSIKCISFKFKNVSFRIEHSEKSMQLYLFENNELVFQISDYSSYSKPTKVLALTKKGEWAKFLLESWQAIQIENQKLRNINNYKGVEDIKNKFHK